jgi:hypothetical protein
MASSLSFLIILTFILKFVYYTAGTFVRISTMHRIDPAAQSISQYLHQNVSIDDPLIWIFGGIAIVLIALSFPAARIARRRRYW